MEDILKLTLSEVVELGARNELVAGAGMLENPELASDDAQRELVRILFTDPRFHDRRSTFGRNARKVVVYHVVERRDRATLEMLERIADDAAHPLRTEALEELLSTRDRAIIAPLYARFVPAVLDAHPFDGYTHRLALGATYVMGADAVTRELVPRYLTEAAVNADSSGLSRASAVIFELIHQIGAGNVANDDARLIDATLALESFKPLKKPWQKLHAVLDAGAVARARGGIGGGAPAAVATAPAKTKKSRARKEASATAVAVPGAAGGYLARYEAGEHCAVWTELRALGEKVHEPAAEAEARAVAAATMKRFIANVEAIAAVLTKAKYTRAETKAVRPPARDAAGAIDALAMIARSPLPMSLVAFYEACDGVSLAQDVEAMIDESPVFREGVLDELGRCDPLIVARLAHMREDAEAQDGNADGVRLYLAPDPAAKGTIDDEISDENPVRTRATRTFDAELSGGAQGYFVDWLRCYVEAGGFLGPLANAERAQLRVSLKPF